MDNLYRKYQDKFPQAQPIFVLRAPDPEALDNALKMALDRGSELTRSEMVELGVADAYSNPDGIY